MAQVLAGVGSAGDEWKNIKAAVETGKVSWAGWYSLGPSQSAGRAGECDGSEPRLTGRVPTLVRLRS